MCRNDFSLCISHCHEMYFLKTWIWAFEQNYCTANPQKHIKLLLNLSALSSKATKLSWSRAELVCAERIKNPKWYLPDFSQEIELNISSQRSWFRAH